MDPSSPFRSLPELQDVFKYFPRLKYSLAPTIWEDSEVEFLKLKTLNEEAIPLEKIAEAIGNLFAVSLFFGLTDLHAWNIMFGLHDSGEFVLGPIDVECLFASIKIPSQTHLLPSKSIPYEHTGLLVLKEFLGEERSLLIPNIIKSFLESYSALYQFQNQLENILTSPPYSESPLRLLLKATRLYHEALQTKSTTGLIPEEIQQVSRGDIPFFYCYQHKPGIYYLNNHDEDERVQNIASDSIPTYPKIETLKKKSSTVQELAPAIAEICHFLRTNRQEEITNDRVTYWNTLQDYGVIIDGVRIKCV